MGAAYTSSCVLMVPWDQEFMRVWVTEDGEELRGKRGIPGTQPDIGIPEGAIEREDMRSVSMWMMKGARPEAEGQRVIWVRGGACLQQSPGVGPLVTTPPALCSNPPSTPLYYDMG
eukprot:COSAG05_NODE_12437_length_468_cov_0.661247_2_plen_116_part_00